MLCFGQFYFIFFKRAFIKNAILLLESMCLIEASGWFFDGRWLVRAALSLNKTEVVELRRALIMGTWKVEGSQCFQPSLPNPSISPSSISQHQASLNSASAHRPWVKLFPCPRALLGSDRRSVGPGRMQGSRGVAACPGGRGPQALHSLAGSPPVPSSPEEFTQSKHPFFLPLSKERISF